ncbi:MAG: Gfo/Idh/MocA family oxidoreductase, partial [Acidobacteria bacterium]|nr:Gfo/Idh/MocA family oxidoreductase [Acidobacteriota bacterium]
MAMGAGIIGLGFVGRAHLEGLRRLGISVRGILGSSPERTADAVRELKLDRGYSSIEELLGDASVSAVHICTPNNLHYQQAR